MSNSFATPWTVAHQIPLSVEFSRREPWTGLLFPSSGDLHDTGIESMSPALAGTFFTTDPRGKPWPRCCVLSLQLYLTLCNPMNYRPPGSSVQGIIQAKILVACPSPEDLPDPGIEPTSLMSPVLADRYLPLVSPGKPIVDQGTDVENGEM